MMTDLAIVLYQLENIDMAVDVLKKHAERLYFQEQSLLITIKRLEARIDALEADNKAMKEELARTTDIACSIGGRY